MTKTIFMIHGMWVSSWVWDNYKSILENRGYTCISPDLRHHKIDADSLPDLTLGTTSILDYVADLEAEITKLDSLPIIIGHSMGGVIAQILASRGLADKLILLTPAAPHGIWGLIPNIHKIFGSILTKPLFWEKPIRQKFEEFVFSTTHLLSEDAQRNIFSRFVDESGRALLEIGLWFLDKHKATQVDASQITCPTLVIAGDLDRMTPPNMVKKIAKKYDHVATYKEFPEHSHWIVGDPNWEEVAEFIADWLTKAE